MSSKEIFSNESAELFAELTAGELQLLLLRHIQEILVQLQIRNQASLEYVPRLVPDISSAVSLEELYKSVLQAAEQHEAGQPAPTSEKEHSFGATPVEPLSSIIRGINNTLESIELLRYWALILKYRQKLLEEEPRASLCCINVTTVDIGTIVTFKQGADSMIQLRPEVEQELQKETRCQTFLSMVCSLLHHLREKNWAPTSNELLCIEAAYNLLEQGYRLPASYCSVGDPGQLSITDPGPDNIRVTTRSEKLLDGVIVHTEYIDRGKEGDKQIIEAYRLPSHIWAAKVRLHIGDAAPCSAYIGRPIFEGLGLEGDLTNVIYKEHSIDLFKAALLKTVHTIASACSIMFAHGICDCKIAMERMTGEQMIEFMKAVRGNVIRNKDRQVLAAAFNLFMPIRYQGALVTEPFEIAKLGIKLAYLGGFDKVTWDAARDEISPHDKPEPITKVLMYHQMLELVHLAHEKGMLTYFSAGIGLDNIRQIVFTGVDGIGIGTYLHYKTEGKPMGALAEERVLNVIAARNKAEAEINGKAAKTLAALDNRFFEKTLSIRENEQRLLLFKALNENNVTELENLVKAIVSEEQDQFQCQSRAFSRAQRTLHSKNLMVTPLLEKLGLENPISEAFNRKDIVSLQKCFKLLDNFNRVTECHTIQF